MVVVFPGNISTAVPKVVNTGDDTVTRASVTGGPAGLPYGWNNIPGTWLAACPGAMIPGTLHNGWQKGVTLTSFKKKYDDNH